MRCHGALGSIGHNAVSACPQAVGVQVYRAVLSGMTSVAVKVLHEHDEDMNFGREIAILRSCRHSNIVQFLVRTHGSFQCSQVLPSATPPLQPSAPCRRRIQQALSLRPHHAQAIHARASSASKALVCC